jgi:hypothetical protein
MYDGTAAKRPKKPANTPPADALMLQFLNWVAERPRSYDDAMEAWRSTCPRHTIWEDALEESWIEVYTDGSAVRVALTTSGRAVLDEYAAADPSRSIGSIASGATSQRRTMKPLVRRK